MALTPLESRRRSWAVRKDKTFQGPARSPAAPSHCAMRIGVHRDLVALSNPPAREVEPVAESSYAPIGRYGRVARCGSPPRALGPQPGHQKGDGHPGGPMVGRENCRRATKSGPPLRATCCPTAPSTGSWDRQPDGLPARAVNRPDLSEFDVTVAYGGEGHLVVSPELCCPAQAAGSVVKHPLLRPRRDEGESRLRHLEYCT